MFKNVWLEIAKDKMAMVELTRCAGDFAYFATHYLKYKHPVKGKLPMQFHPYHERLIDHYESNNFSLVTKFRQGAFSTYTIAYMLWTGLFKLDQRILVLAKTDREAMELGSMMQRMIQDLPDWMQPKVGRCNGHTKEFTDTNCIYNFQAPEAACGKKADWLIVDEAAFIPDMDAHWKAMWPTLSCGGKCVLVSTVGNKYLDKKKTKKNWFYDTYERAFNGHNKFKIFDVNYKEHPDYADPKVCNDLKNRLGKDGWKQEIEMEFLD